MSENKVWIWGHTKNNDARGYLASMYILYLNCINFNQEIPDNINIKIDKFLKKYDK